MQVIFAEGRIEEFIEAQSVSAELMATPEVAVSIAAAMAHFHFSMLKHFTMLDHLPSCMSPVAQIWDRLREWACIGTELYKPEELKQHDLGHIRQEVGFSSCIANIQAQSILPSEPCSLLCCLSTQPQFQVSKPWFQEGTNLQLLISSQSGRARGLPSTLIAVFCQAVFVHE